LKIAVIQLSSSQAGWFLVAEGKGRQLSLRPCWVEVHLRQLASASSLPDLSVRV